MERVFCGFYGKWKTGSTSWAYPSNVTRISPQPGLYRPMPPTGSVINLILILKQNKFFSMTPGTFDSSSTLKVIVPYVSNFVVDSSAICVECWLRTF